MKLKEEWEIVYQAEKASREKLEGELKDAWKKNDSFSVLSAWARLCAWDEAHPAFVRHAAILKMQEKALQQSGLLPAA